jgi:hypothetical protein
LVYRLKFEAVGDAARETANRRHGDVRRGVTVRLHVSEGSQFFGHAVILQKNPVRLRHDHHEPVVELLLLNRQGRQRVALHAAVKPIIELVWHQVASTDAAVGLDAIAD